MQLSSRILTALAVLILAVAVVAVRAGSPGMVEAATGTIDVVNVGTCYTTDPEVFLVDDCKDGDATTGYKVAGRETITETGTVYTTYAHDPKTAPDSPRGILMYSNVIKISISDTGRDLRTPVLLGVGGTPASDLLTEDDDDTADVDESGPTVNLGTIREEFRGISPEETDFRWLFPGGNVTDAQNLSAADTGRNKVITGITINKNGVDATYKPMFVVDGDGSPISLYGTFDADGTGDSNPEFMKLNTYLVIDEDVGSGRVVNETGNDELEVAPWFSVRESIPQNAIVRVMYVVYETSEKEALVNGRAAGDYQDDTTTDFNEATLVPRFTKSDGEPGKLVVEARSDGREPIKGLWLEETARFSGRYEGFLKITDPNGTDDGWGLLVGDATGAEIEKAATLGVESGPVTIAYQDTDGTPQMLRVSVDTVPPEVQIDTPMHETEGQDTSPEFSGTFTDDNSGLRKSTFRLYVDHQDDEGENGEDANSLALPLKVDVPGSAYGYVTSDNGVVESLGDYAGYAATDAEPTFGVIRHGELFDRADNSTIKMVDGDNHDDGATDGTFGDSIRIAFIDDETDPDATYNNTIDFQALVADVAGNIGFSDSDPDGPRFINDLGEKDPGTDRYNVLGWYARHVFFLDETDPAIFEEQSVTGFYGFDDDPIPNRSGILIAFDKAVDPDSFGVETFEVTLDPIGGAGTIGASADVVDIDVVGRRVFLLLDEELASDATPQVDVASGQWVSDPAGNRLTGGDVEPFEVNDGISPTITVALSGGSGTGEGDEGPDKLTMNSIVVTISSDEEISSTPALVVVCSSIAWDSDDADDKNDKGLSDLISQRSGALTNGTADFALVPVSDNNTDERNGYSCDNGDTVVLQQAQSYSRPGLEWEYQWVNFSRDKRLSDGELTVVAYAHDRRSYQALTKRDISGPATNTNTRYSWGAGTAEFRFDDTPPKPAPTPKKDATVTETRPFVLLTYEDNSTVSIDSFSVDGTAQEITVLGENRFLYWPEALGIGSHTVSVDAIDAAGNDDSYEYSFKVAERGSFNLKLIAGWNAVSFPGNPIDPMIGDVFTEDVIDMVAGWDATDPQKPWSIATKMEGEWSTHTDFATLNRVSARYGYWVHAQGFVTQKVQLVGQIDRTDANVVPADLVTIPTEPGWNFVGVISQDGRQTQSHDGKPLMTDGDNVSSGSYLGDNKRAYTWDAIRSEFKILENGDDVTIGDGIWVYYGGGIAP